MVREYIPKTNIELVTNGDVLNSKRLNKLFENGLNKILIVHMIAKKTPIN